MKLKYLAAINGMLQKYQNLQIALLPASWISLFQHKLCSEGYPPAVECGTKKLSNLDFLTLGRKVKPILLEGATTAIVAPLVVQGIDVEAVSLAKALG